MPHVPPHTRAGCRTLARDARTQGLAAITRQHVKFGWSVWTVTPWHDREVRLLDAYDVQYLLAELAHSA